MEHSGRYISNRLRKHRLAMNYTQSEAAALIGGCNRMRISEWERGVSMPSGEHLLRLAKIYHVPAEVLYTDHMASFAYSVPILEQKLREAKAKRYRTNDNV